MEAFQTKGQHTPSSRQEEEGPRGCSVECEEGRGRRTTRGSRARSEQALGTIRRSSGSSSWALGSQRRALHRDMKGLCFSKISLDAGYKKTQRV